MCVWTHGSPRNGADFVLCHRCSVAKNKFKIHTWLSRQEVEMSDICENESKKCESKECIGIDTLKRGVMNAMQCDAMRFKWMRKNKIKLAFQEKFQRQGKISKATINCEA
jgi:hypothetical protein